jgi:GT2 family glycosyltransferase
MANSLYVTTIVFSRHDLLRRLFESCAASTRRPDAVYVIDHGGDEEKVKALEPALDGIQLGVVTLEDYGCAAAANWFLKTLPDDRVGVGDDITFAPDCLEIMANTPGDFVIPERKSFVVDGVECGIINPAACCLIRKSLTDKIGFFDEKISPNYLYFEDTDFIRRMELAGIPQTQAVGAQAYHCHGGSQTLKQYTPAQLDEHHRRFRIARANYNKKWGGDPFSETLTVPVGL